SLLPRRADGGGGGSARSGETEGARASGRIRSPIAHTPPPSASLTPPPTSSVRGRSEAPKRKEPGLSAGLQTSHRTVGDRDQKLMSIVERRFSGSFTPSPVATAEIG